MCYENQQKTHIIIALEPKIGKGGNSNKRGGGGHGKKEFDFIWTKHGKSVCSYRNPAKTWNGKGLFYPVLI